MRRPWDAISTRIITLVALFAASGFYESLRQRSLNSITNGDFWWHLRTGLGILEAHALPHSGLYSQSADLPWMASSWLYDVKVALGYRMFGLLYIPMMAIACKLALAVLTFLLAGGLRGRFWTAVALSGTAQYVLGSMQPLPVYASVLFFGILLMLLMESRRTGSARPLYWLPPLFLLWANLDVRFVYGIAMLLLFVIACWMEQQGARAGMAWIGQANRLPRNLLGAITAGSLLATVVTPYGRRSYGLFFAQASSAANPYFPDFLALRFRTPQDYVLLLLTMAAFLALGIRRSRDLFPIGLLLLCTIASFRAQRDAWLVTLAAVAIIAYALPETLPESAKDDAGLGRSQFRIAVGLGVVLLVAASAIHLPHGRKAMLAEIGEGYPVAAADYVREHHLPAPLFNAFPWGGFLTWYLPEYPVAIDGRTDLYGDDFNIQYAKAMDAQMHYSAFPPLNQAGTILLEKNSLMGSALANVAGFKVAYSDDVAVVLVREQPHP